MKKLPCLMNARLTDHTKLMAEKLKQREPCLVRSQEDRNLRNPMKKCLLEAFVTQQQKTM